MLIVLIIVAVEFLVAALGKSHEYIYKPMMSDGDTGMVEVQERRIRVLILWGCSFAAIIALTLFLFFFGPLHLVNQLWSSGNYGMVIVLVLIAVEILIFALSKTSMYVYEPTSLKEEGYMGEVKNRRNKMLIRWAAGIAVFLIVIFVLFFFSPRQRFKRAINDGNLGTAAKIYEEMSKEDQQWAEDYTVEAAGNALGNLF